MKNPEKSVADKQAKDFENFIAADGVELNPQQKHYLRLCIGMAYCQSRIDAYRELRTEGE